MIGIMIKMDPYKQGRLNPKQYKKEELDQLLIIEGMNLVSINIEDMSL